MELKLDKKFIDEAVQEAVKDIKQNFIEKTAIDKIRQILSQNRIATDRYGDVVLWSDIKKVLEEVNADED